MKFVLGNSNGGRREFERDAIGVVREFHCVDFDTFDELMKFMKDNEESYVTVFSQSVEFPQYPEIYLGDC